MIEFRVNPEKWEWYVSAIWVWSREKDQLEPTGQYWSRKKESKCLKSA